MGIILHANLAKLQGTHHAGRGRVNQQFLEPHVRNSQALWRAASFEVKCSVHDMG